MPDEDPEVVADRMLQARTIRERGSTASERTYSRPIFVDKWPCRVCKKPVAITDIAVDSYNQYNRMLKPTGERIDHANVLYCDTCIVEFRRTAPDRRRGQVERMRVVIQKLKSSRNPEQERELIKQLETWGHPDVPALVSTLRAKLDGKGKRDHTGGL